MHIHSCQPGIGYKGIAGIPRASLLQSQYGGTVNALRYTVIQIGGRSGLEHPRSYTKEEMNVYKSLEGYRFLIAGWVGDILFLSLPR